MKQFKDKLFFFGTKLFFYFGGFRTPKVCVWGKKGITSCYNFGKVFVFPSATLQLNIKRKEYSQQLC